MDLNVRRIRPDDGLLLKRVRLAALADAPSAFAGTYEDEAGRSDDEWHHRAEGGSRGADRAAFFAEFDGDVRGLVGGNRCNDAELVSMWVHPTARGSGAAEALLGAVIEWAQGPLELSVVQGNARAIAFYRRMGFIEVSDFQSSPSDPCANEMRMRLGQRSGS